MSESESSTEDISPVLDVASPSSADPVLDPVTATGDEPGISYRCKVGEGGKEHQHKTCLERTTCSHCSSRFDMCPRLRRVEAQCNRIIASLRMASFQQHRACPWAICSRVSSAPCPATRRLCPLPKHTCLYLDGLDARARTHAPTNPRTYSQCPGCNLVGRPAAG